MPRDPLPPSCAARFAFVRTLASGGFGSVHLAVQRGLERRVVVKLLHDATLEDAEQVRRFQEEARMTAALDCPQVVKLIDVGFDGVPWIAYELLAGSSLRELADAGRFPVARAARAASDVLLGLAAAHERGILHRDVKPENVVRGEDGTYKLTDFGIAKWTRDGAVKTRTGVVLGTPAYMPPEAVRGDPLTPASDVYAVGVMLHELLAGEPPFTDANPLTLMQRHLESRPPRVSLARPDVPRGLEVIVERALAKDPADRFPSARDMADALAPFRAGEEVGDAPEAAARAARTVSAPVSATVIAPRRISGVWARRARGTGMLVLFFVAVGLIRGFSRSEVPLADVLEEARRLDAAVAQAVRAFREEARDRKLKTRLLRPELRRRCVVDLRLEKRAAALETNVRALLERARLDPAGDLAVTWPLFQAAAIAVALQVLPGADLDVDPPVPEWTRPLAHGALADYISIYFETTYGSSEAFAARAHDLRAGLAGRCTLADIAREPLVYAAWRALLELDVADMRKRKVRDAALLDALFAVAQSVDPRQGPRLSVDTLAMLTMDLREARDASEAAARLQALPHLFATCDALEPLYPRDTFYLVREAAALVKWGVQHGANADVDGALHALAQRAVDARAGSFLPVAAAALDFVAQVQRRQPTLYGAGVKALGLSAELARRFGNGRESDLAKATLEFVAAQVREAHGLDAAKHADHIQCVAAMSAAQQALGKPLIDERKMKVRGWSLSATPTR